MPRGINMTDHKVLGDLLHVLIVEESVEAQFVCRKEREMEGIKQTERTETEDEGRQQGAAGEVTICAREDTDTTHDPILCLIVLYEHGSLM